MEGVPIDVAFIGSCTNSRISDLREVAHVLEGRRVSESVKTLVVPGSQQVKAQAEAEGLDKIFTAAGAEWREPGCSMCLAMNPINSLGIRYVRRLVIETLWGDRGVRQDVRY